ncbi:MAG TPA: SDR family oxidoreductase [Bryobacteraceae bacterium]|jgi:3-oxoacyl-[acyl-carrier protein] reductase
MVKTASVIQEFEGKTALITGASRGIGAAAANAFATAGVRNFILHYNAHRQGIDELVKQLGETVSCRVIQADLAQEAGIESFVSDLRKLNPPVDFLINNAGFLVQRAKLAESTPELWDRVMNLNAKSAWFVTQAVVPGMIDRGGGSVVNLSSIAARNGGGVGAAMYAASKATVACFTKGLSRELASKGIRVNAVSPGTVDNHFHEVFSTQPMMDSMKASTTVGKLGTNEEVADVIVFLCSDGARYIHGQTIEINGGMFMV